MTNHHPPLVVSVAVKYHVYLHQQAWPNSKQCLKNGSEGGCVERRSLACEKENSKQLVVEFSEFRSCVKVESWGFRPNEPYGFCGRKATLNHASALVTVCP